MGVDKREDGSAAPVSAPEREADLTQSAGIADLQPRRLRILLAAIDLFDRNGYLGTPIDAIGKASGITGPAIYRHFNNKSELLEAAFGDTMRFILDEGHRIARTEGITAREKLERIIKFHIGYVLDNPALMRIVRAEARHLPNEARIAFRGMQAQYLDLFAELVREHRAWDTVEGSRALSFGLLNMLNGFSQRHNQLARPQLDRLLKAMATSLVETRIGGDELLLLIN